MTPPGIPPAISLGIPPSQNVNLMVIDHLGMGLIPACSWRHAQQPPANRIEICLAVVHESGIEYNSPSIVLKTPSTEDSEILGFDVTGM